MGNFEFVHLHLHTEYSLLDGAIRIDELIEEAKKYQMPAVAITDHGNIFGVVEFYKKAKKAGIKPIIGCELYIAPGSRFEKTKLSSDPKMPEEASFHLTVLAENQEGYRNLTRLVTAGYMDGFYYRPRIDLELLKEHSKGLFVLSGCLKGEIPYSICIGNQDRAEKLAKQLKEIFEDRFYLEIQSNSIPEQHIANRGIVEISKKYDIPIVATNDCHYLRREDYRAHDILLCIQTGKTVNDPKRMRFQTNEFYFKSPEEIYRDFSEIPEAIKNSLAIAERVNFEFQLGVPKLPVFEVPEGLSDESFLSELALQGLRERFKGEIPEEYQRRLNTELETITKMGFSSYFLIVWDFINYARKRGIPVGPGRGSAAGSLVAYALRITDVDPIRYGLLFERFLNPERISLPDIDVDFCKDRREEVIRYVTEKYGKDRVAHIITFGTMAARAVVRDVGRALNIPYGEVDRIAKMIPLACSSLESALKVEPKLKEIYESNQTVRELIDIAKRLEGLARHVSQHAAGVVISPEPLENFMALYKNPSDENRISQFDMKSIEDIGLLKFDFLGLKTLTVIDETVKFAKLHGKTVDLENIPLDDSKTYQLLKSGHTTGVFQLESKGMRELLQKMEPERFEDLIALVALYRPGPLGSGMVDDFIKRKKKLVPIEYSLPELKEILDETYGIILYQEQVMQIANRIAGFTMGQADVLRKAMGKKIPELMASLKDDFINGAVLRNVPKEEAENLFNLMAAFGEYGFNKSHSAAYAKLAYITAYLKAHHPLEFFAANLSHEIGDTNKLLKFINECKSFGIEIKGPDINESEPVFTIRGNSIRFGLEAVKGVGASAIEAIMAERKKGRFTSFEDFLRRVDTKRVNKKVIESLINAGAFDSLYGDLPPNLSRPLALKQLHSQRGKSNGGVHRKKASEQVVSLFELTNEVEEISQREQSNHEEQWSNETLLAHEKSSLGFYLSGHPMEHLRVILNKRNIIPIEDITEISSDEIVQQRAESEEVKIAGIVEKVNSKAKEKGVVGYVTIADETGILEVVIYPDLFKRYREVLREGALVAIKGSINLLSDSVKFFAREIEEIREEDLKISYELNIDCCDEEKALQSIRRISKFLRRTGNGNGSLFINLHFNDFSILIQSPYELSRDFLLRADSIEGCRVRAI